MPLSKPAPRARLPDPGPAATVVVAADGVAGAGVVGLDAEAAQAPLLFGVEPVPAT
jgi:hypothetical protein